MKTKNILGLVAIVAIAVAVAFNVSITNQKQDAASMLALANVEALAGGEVTFPYLCMGDNGLCYVETDWRVIRGVRIW
jgi:hypothetical protein